MTAPQPVYNRLKIITLTIGGVDFSTQITSWTASWGIKAGSRIWTFSSAGEGHNSVIEETDGEPTLELKWLADFTEGGLSDYLAANNMANAAFLIDHHPDIVGEHVQLSGTVQLNAPDIGGDARADETQSVTLPIVGTAPTYTRVS